MQGYKKRELSVDGVSAQLWIITKVADNDAYYLENANSCTYLTLKDGMCTRLVMKPEFPRSIQHICQVSPRITRLS